MDDDFIVTTFVVIAKTMAALGHRDHVLARASDAEVLTVAVVAARSFQHHLERALQMLHLGRYLSGPLSVSRFNASPARAARLAAARPGDAGDALRDGRGVPHRQHAGPGLPPRPPLPQGQRPGILRLLRRQARAVLRLAAAPGLHHRRGARRLRPRAGRAAGATVYGDKGDNAAADEATIQAETGGRSVPIRKANMRPNDWADTLALREYRKRIEALYSQCEALGVQRLRARTNPGLQLKVHASLLAATIANAD